MKKATSIQSKTNLRLLPLMVIFLISSHTVGKSPNGKHRTVETIDRIVQEEMIMGNLVGLAVGVVKDGRVIHLKSYGSTDIEGKTPFTNMTVFRWASISKVITAVAVHQLKEDGKLGLNDKIADKVGYWPKDGEKKDITVRQLLSHRSGIQHYAGYDRRRYEGRANAAWNASQSVDVFKRDTLLFSPDSAYAYSTFAYNLLGALVHEVGGGFDRHINTRIRNKLGMTMLTYNSAVGIKGYDKKCDDILTQEDESDVIWRVPGGGFLSDIADLLKFMMGLMNGTLLNSTSDLWNEVPNGQRGYSLGLNRVLKGDNKILFVEHEGAHIDMRTKMIFHPTRKDGIVIAVNGGGYAQLSRNRIVDRIADATGIYSSTMTGTPVHYSGSVNEVENPKEKKKEPLKEPCKGLHVAVWHQNADRNVVLRKGYSAEAFREEYLRLRSAGYLCKDFESYTMGDKRVWDGVFSKQSGAQAMWRDYEYDDFFRKWQEMGEQGLRLMDLETYRIGTKRLYAGLFSSGSGRYAMFRGLSTGDFGSKRDELAKSGHRLIDIEVYSEGGEPKWCGVWVEGQDGLLDRNYDLDEFQRLVNKRKSEGWNLVDVETYVIGRKRKWAGIWEKSPLKQEYLFNYRHDGSFSRKLNENTNNWMVLSDLEKVED